MSQLKFHLYELLSTLVPRSSQQRLGRSKYLRPLRDNFFRSEGLPDIARDTIEFEKRTFRFSAPYQTLARAKKGIESRLSRLILEYCIEGAHCIDVGANYGFISIMMSLAAGPRGSVFSFEPDPFVCKVLKENISDNNLENVCSVYQKAVGAEQKNLRSEDPPTRLTIDEFMSTRSHGVDLIKIDVDGEDYEVLLGAQRVLKEFRPLLMVEATRNQKEIYQFLKDVGYEYILDMKGKPVSPGAWPPNLIAAMTPVQVPSRGSLVTSL